MEGFKSGSFLIVVATAAGCAAGPPPGWVQPKQEITGFPTRTVSLGLDRVAEHGFEIQTAENDTNEERTRIIVKGATGAREHAFHSEAGCVSEEIPTLGMSVITLRPGAETAFPMARIRAIPGIEYVEIDHQAQAVFVPNDPSFPSQWGYGPIQAGAAWDVTQSSDSVKIAILDSGIDQDHEDLATKLAGNKNFSNSKSVDDKYGHGTHVAGIAAAVTHNGKGVAGVAIHAKLLNVKILNDRGTGQYSWIIKGLAYAADSGAQVVNLSVGGSSFSQALQDAVDYAVGKGVVVVAAAGNDNSSNKLYPAAVPSAIAVAATTQADQKASFSNHGDWVDVAAPGDGIYSTLPNHRNAIGPKNYGQLSGTSMATPFVAGQAALLAAVPSPNSIRSRIESTCDAIAGTGTQFAFGRINLLRAVNAP